MKHFAPTDESLTPSDSQYNNLRQPPTSLMATGFLGARPGRIGSPVVAEWMNWLFSQLTVAAPFYVDKPSSGDIEFPNFFRYRVNGVQAIKAFEVRGFDNNGLLQFSRMIAVPSYTTGTTVNPITGVTVKASTITVAVNSLSSSATHIVITPITERP